jgi:hypothetical protein
LWHPIRSIQTQDAFRDIEHGTFERDLLLLGMTLQRLPLKRSLYDIQQLGYRGRPLDPRDWTEAAQDRLLCVQGQVRVEGRPNAVTRPLSGEVTRGGLSALSSQ